jgi:hypothetical protein
MVLSSDHSNAQSLGRPPPAKASGRLLELWRRGRRGAKMDKHPIESNFYVNVSDTEVELTFAPTKSIYTFSRLPAIDLISPNALVRHLGRKGDTYNYDPMEVQAMAYRVALATIKRLRLKPPDLQRWPLVSRK